MLLLKIRRKVAESLVSTCAGCGQSPGNAAASLHWGLQQRVGQHMQAAAAAVPPGGASVVKP
jgi:hypothetical protein